MPFLFQHKLKIYHTQHSSQSDHCIPRLEAWSPRFSGGLFEESSEAFYWPVWPPESFLQAEATSLLSPVCWGDTGPFTARTAHALVLACCSQMVSSRLFSCPLGVCQSMVVRPRCRCFRLYAGKSILLALSCPSPGGTISLLPALVNTSQVSLPLLVGRGKESCRALWWSGRAGGSPDGLAPGRSGQQAPSLHFAGPIGNRHLLVPPEQDAETLGRQTWVGPAYATARQGDFAVASPIRFPHLLQKRSL